MILRILIVFVLFCSTLYGDLPEIFHVEDSCHGKPFDYIFVSKEKKDLFTVCRFKCPSSVVTPFKQNNTIVGEYYLPDGALSDNRKRCVVISLHILEGNFELTRLVCSTLASRGVPALMFMLPYYGDRAPVEGRRALSLDPDLFVSAMKQGIEDVKRMVDLLSSRNEVDGEKIGITGISLGGIIASSAAGADQRINRVFLTLAGGDLWRIIHHARETSLISSMINSLPERKRKEVQEGLRELDPLTCAGKVKGRRILMVNAEDDEVIPRQCTERLAGALGISDRVIWIRDVGHYTAIASLSRILELMGDFFLEDAPKGLIPGTAPQDGEVSPYRVAAGLIRQVSLLFSSEPDGGTAHVVELEGGLTLADGKKIECSLRFIRGHDEMFCLDVSIPGIAECAIGFGKYPWMHSKGKRLFTGSSMEVGPLDFADRGYVIKVKAGAGALAGFAMAPSILDQFITLKNEGARTLVIEPKKGSGSVRLVLKDDGSSPQKVTFDVEGIKGEITFPEWRFNTPLPDAVFDPPRVSNPKTVESTDLVHIFSAFFNFALERVLDKGRGPDSADEGLHVEAEHPGGLLCRKQGKTLLFLQGTPEQMGEAHGVLLRDRIRKLTERVLYLVGGADTLNSGIWFKDRMSEIEKRVLPFLPERFFRECDAMSAAAGIPPREGRFANLFPERFHCSGVAVRGAASRNGKTIHARVLDYMSPINIQREAVVTLFMPEKMNAWISLGYAGFVGTVTCMNDRGLAIGEMGGRGEGNWDGIPMSLLLREIMEKASNVDQGLEILKKGPRTCEYYYVLSDSSGNMAAVHATPEAVAVLLPGEQHAELPHVPEETVLISGGSRAIALSRRIQEHYGSIDVEKMINIIKRPVASNQNLHNAVFVPETADMWFADAGRETLACNEPYVHFNLHDLILFFENRKP
jgi:isopenicillin-N N-acyltransferase like protein